MPSTDDPIGTVRYNPISDYFIRKMNGNEWAVYPRGQYDPDSGGQENMPDDHLSESTEHPLTVVIR